MSASRDIFPSSTSKRIAIAVISFDTEPMSKTDCGVIATLSSRLAIPYPCSYTIFPPLTTARAHPGELVVFHSAKIRSTLSANSCGAAEAVPATRKQPTSASAACLIGPCFLLEAVAQRELHDARAG